MNENNLVQSARSGNLDDFNELVLKYQDQVYRQALYILGDDETAQDCSQEAFLLAYQKLSSFRDGSLRAWLLRIVTNVCIDELRRRKRQPVSAQALNNESGDEIETSTWLVDGGPSVEALVEQKEMRTTIRGIIYTLPEQYRMTLNLVDFMELNYEEAADILQVPVGTIKSRLARARMQMREKLIAQAVYPKLKTQFIPGSGQHNSANKQASCQISAPA